MSGDRFSRAREVFLAALEEDPARRPAFLDEACGGDEELRHDVESLCAHHDEYLEETAAGPADRSSANRGSGQSPQGAPSDATPRFESGQVFAGRYRIVAELGRGGMGEVYRAHDLVLDEPVALKFLTRSGGLHFERLLNEVRMARQVTHPNVCRVYDFGEAGGETYLTMEYIDGENLASLLARIGRLPQDKLLDLAHQLCAGLAAAHAKGVLHRDLKPANIMIDGRGQARITDFGIASEAPTETSGGGERGLIVGTPAYMAPEQLAGRHATARSDLYALGLVLHEMATGRPVFSAATPAQFAELHRSAPPMPPSRQVTHLDPDLETVILRCLEKDPRDRPASARELAAKLPGADQLALALAAGQTPAPEVVAAARTDDGLSPGTAAAWLAALLAILAGVLVLSDRAYPTRARWADRAPAVMTERCQQILERLGHGAAEPRAGDRARGFYPGGDGVGKSGEELFWYRRGPQQLVPTHFAAIFYPRVDFDDPPPLDAGMVRMLVDADGRLLALRAVAAEDPDGDEDGDEDGDAGKTTVDWTGVLAAAGFDAAAFSASPPRSTPPVFADQRAAWASSEVRIEAAADGDRVVFFAATWEDQPSGDATGFDWDRLWVWYLNVSEALFFGLALGAVVLARINLRARRGDLRGARRLAIFVAALNAASWVFELDHLPNWDDLTRWELTLGRMLLQAAIAWLAYIALEPIVRRWWPRSLISWSRLLSGRLRDPLVGRSLLIGALVGAAWSLFTVLDRLVTAWAGLEPAPEIFVLSQLEVALSGRLAIAELLTSAIEAAYRGVLDLFFLVGLRVVLRRWWLAIVVFVAVNGSLEILQGIHPLVSWLTLALGITGVTAFVLVRFGLLTYVTALFCYLSLIVAPLSLDLTAWFAETGFFILAMVAAIGAFGYWTALAGRPFAAALTEFESESGG